MIGAQGNTCEIVAGRLLEIRLVGGYVTVGDVDDMIAMIGANVRALPPDVNIAIAADWRTLRVMKPDTAERVHTMLTSVNPRVTRSAILTLPVNPTTNLQVVRLVRESENPHRRHFTSTAEMRAWLGEVLEPHERARLATFLP